MRVAFYGRYSTAMQKESSIEDQLRNCQQYAQREGWKITKQYQDKAQSGSDKNRAEYQQMIKGAENNAFDVLLIDDLSRLGRDSVETETTIRKIEFAGIRLIAVSDGYDSQSKSKKVHRGMKNLMNEIFLDDLSQKIKRGMAGAVERGFAVGGKTFGYKSTPIFHPTEKDNYGRPVIESVKREIHEEEAKIVKHIFQLFVDGNSYRAIAIKLDKEGIKPLRAKHWHQNGIYSIIKNEIYTGKVIWNQSHWPKCPTTGKRKRVVKPESEWIIKQDNKLRIITQKLWDKALERRAEQAENGKAIRKSLHKNARTGASPKYLFSGLLRCSECGGRYVVVSRTSYGCATRQRHGDSACSNKVRVNRETAEKRLLESLKTDLFQPEVIELFKKETTRLLTAQKKMKEPDTEQARKRLATVEKEIESMVSAIKSGAFSDTLKEALETSEKEKLELLAKLRINTKGLDKISAFIPDVTNHYERLLSSLDKTLQTDIAKARTQIKALLGDSIKLYPQPEGYVEAELTANYAGMVNLCTKGKISHKSVEAFGAFEVFEGIIMAYLLPSRNQLHLEWRLLGTYFFKVRVICPRQLITALQVHP